MEIYTTIKGMQSVASVYMSRYSHYKLQGFTYNWYAISIYMHLTVLSCNYQRWKFVYRCCQGIHLCCCLYLWGSSIDFHYFTSCSNIGMGLFNAMFYFYYYYNIIRMEYFLSLIIFAIFNITDVSEINLVYISEIYWYLVYIVSNCSTVVELGISMWVVIGSNPIQIKLTSCLSRRK